MTTTVLSPESVIEIVKSIGSDDPLSIARDIEQAVLQSDEIQALRRDIGTFRGGLVILIHTLEQMAEAVDIDLAETRISATSDGKGLGSSSISEVIAKLRAAMEKQT